MFLSLVAVAFILCAASAGAASDKIVLKPVDMTKLKFKDGSQAFQIIDGEVSVNGRFIKRIDMPSVPKGRQHAAGQYAVLFKNKTGSTMRPQVNVRAYNRYGMYLDSFWIIWRMDTIANEGTYTETKNAHHRDLREIFEHSSIEIPADFDDPAYVLITDESESTDR